MSLLVISCSALVVSENLGNALPVAGSLPLTETGLPPRVTVVPDFLADFFFASLLNSLFCDLFNRFLLGFFLRFSFLMP